MRGSTTPERERVLSDRLRTGENPSAVAPAGWYPDPSDASKKRYWDGAAWQNMAVPASGLPGLSRPGTARSAMYASRPVYEIAPIPHRQLHWTPDRIVSLTAVVLLGGLGWVTIVGFIARRVTGGEASALVYGLIGLIDIGLLIGWTVVMVALYSDVTHYYRRASRRAWRLVGWTWLAVFVVGIITGLAN